MEGRDLFVMLIVVGARFFVPLFIPKYPLPAGILALVIDGIDQTIFQIFTTMNLGWYQRKPGDALRRAAADAAGHAL